VIIADIDFELIDKARNQIPIIKNEKKINWPILKDYLEAVMFINCFFLFEKRHSLFIFIDFKGISLL
jgi:hypothetical protein